MPTPDREHFAPVTRPAAALSGTQAIRGWVSFPATGGVQFVDVNGDVVNPATLTGAALLAATQTFTGKNTFAPAAATGVPVGTASFAINLAGAQTLAAGAPGGVQSAVTVSAPTFLGTAPGTTVDLVSTLTIAGPPTIGANLTAGGGAFALVVQSGDTFLTGNLGVDVAVTANGSITSGTSFVLQPSAFALTLTATPLAARAIAFPDASGTVALLGTSQTFTGAAQSLDVGAAGTLQLGGNAAALLGFYGHAVTAQQVLATGAGATVDNVITALQALGLVKQA